MIIPKKMRRSIPRVPENCKEIVVVDVWSEQYADELQMMIKFADPGAWIDDPKTMILLSKWSAKVAEFMKDCKKLSEKG